MQQAKPSKAKVRRTLEKKLELLVEELADEREWNWTHATTERTAADHILTRMVELRIIKHRTHPYGGDVWIINNKMFGRVDELLPIRKKKK